MSKQKVWFLILGGVLFLIAGAFEGWLGMSGYLPRQSDNVYEDPQGRFTLQIDPSWEQIETDGSYTQFKVPDPPMSVYFLVLEASKIDDAFSQALEAVGFDPGLLTGGDVTMIGDWKVYSQIDSAGLMYGLAGQILGESTFVVVCKTDKPDIEINIAVAGRAICAGRWR